MKVLVTGGGGYIGSVLVRMLLERGYGVTVLDRMFFGTEPLKEVEDQITVVRDDVRWFEPSLLDGIDVVIDMAALSNDPSGELDRTKTLEINHKGRVRVANLSKRRGVKKYVLASSCSVYGFRDGILNEDCPVSPLTTYAQANVLWENDTLPLADKHFSVTALRQATVYGLSPRMRFDLVVNSMVASFFKSGKIPIGRDGTQWRPNVHVKDTSNAFIKVIESEPEVVNKQIFNVGSNEQNHQIFPLGKLIANAVGLPFEYEWYGTKDCRSYRVGFNKICDTLGFKPEYTPVEGAKEIFKALQGSIVNMDDMKTKTVEWYKYLLRSSAVPDVAIDGKVL